MIISRTPYRISFFGGGTDFPGWYLQHGGAVLATTIDKYCYLTCRYLPPFFEHRYRIVYSKIESCHHVDEIQHPAVRAVLRHLDMHRGMEIHHDGDLPAWSGVGSSSSFAVGLLHGIHALQGKLCSKEDLALEAIHVEQKILEDLVGSQDQVLAAYGGFNYVEFHTTGQISVHPVTISGERLRELKSHMLLFFTGQSRKSGEVAASYALNLRDKSRQLLLYNAMLKEALLILNSREDLAAFGQLLHEAWQAKRSLSDKVTTPLIDQAYETARSRGALGGKILGAGGGGFLLVFAKPEHHPGILEALGDLLHVPFDFESHGSSIVHYDPEIDYAHVEARRDLIRKTLAESQKL
jgi:D-glycero-alpha-D-manno-heptose-7-phosphate kinase